MRLERLVDIKKLFFIRTIPALDNYVANKKVLDERSEKNSLPTLTSVRTLLGALFTTYFIRYVTSASIGISERVIFLVFVCLKLGGETQCGREHGS